jgi:hypothetical protein
MGHPRASAEILGDLDSSRAEKRTAAVVAAGRARLRQAREKIASLAGSVSDPQLVADALAQLDTSRAPEP